MIHPNPLTPIYLTMGEGSKGETAQLRPQSVFYRCFAHTPCSLPLFLWALLLPPLALPLPPPLSPPLPLPLPPPPPSQRMRRKREGEAEETAREIDRLEGLGEIKASAPFPAWARPLFLPSWVLPPPPSFLIFFPSHLFLPSIPLLSPYMPRTNYFVVLLPALSTEP